MYNSLVVVGFGILRLKDFPSSIKNGKNTFLFIGDLLLKLHFSWGKTIWIRAAYFSSACLRDAFQKYRLYLSELILTINKDGNSGYQVMIKVPGALCKHES